MNRMFTVSGDQAGKRLDLVLSRAVPDFSRARLRKAIEDGLCQVNGTVCFNAAMRLSGTETISITIPRDSARAAPEPGELAILWRDSVLAVCDKPAGITSHPCPSCPRHTFVNILLAHFPQLAMQGGQRPGIAHRLDKDTSGLFLVALTEEVRLALCAAFEKREIHKEYLALVHGDAPENGECAEPVGRHPKIRTRMAVVPESQGGKAARSRWRRLWRSPNGKISLLAVRIFSGRTHQIRVHMAHLGYPILGDAVYAPAKIKAMAPRQMLHAWRLELNHPASGKRLEFMAPPPPDFYETALANARVLRRVVVTGGQGCGKSSFRRELAALGAQTIDADRIVAGLYQKNGHISGWLRTRFGEDLLDKDHGVDKAALFAMLRSDSQFRREFESLVHALVLDEIKLFWKRNEERGQALAVAEIPLYFECGWQKLLKPRPFVIGVHCAQKERWQRIMRDRGWSLEKIRTLENWQLPEESKMAACDLAIDNTDSADFLKSEARRTLALLEEQNRAAKERLLGELRSLCGST